MLTRRHLAQAAALWTAWQGAGRPLAARAALPVPPAPQIDCRIMRKGEQIGLAAFRFDRQGSSLRVRIDIELAVKLGPIPLFRYRHHNVETWEGDELTGLDAKTDDDGTPRFMSAIRGPNGLHVNGSHTEPYIAPPHAMGTSYWNANCVSVPLINTEDGHLMNVTVTPAGTENVLLASGARVAAREYNIRGEVRIDLWYEPSQEFAALRYYAKDGSVVTYERL